MPDELNRLLENIAYGVERVVVAIRSRKDDDSKFHALVTPGGDVGISILTQRVHRIHEAAEISQRRCFLRLPGDFFLAIFLSPDADPNSRLFFDAHPILFICRPRAIPNPSPETFSVMVEPAAINAPSPTRTGATSAESLPIKTLFPMVVGCL